jgi:hypothetical protein
MKLSRALVLTVSLTIGCGQTAAPLPACSAAIPAGAVATTTLDGASSCTEAGAVTLAKQSDLSADGYTVVGPAFVATGTGPFPHGIDIVVPYDPLKVKPELTNQIVILAQRGNAAAHNALVTNIAVEPLLGRVHFHTLDIATYQAAIRTDAGRMVSRHFTYRAFAGPSMGGFGSSVNFWLHPDRYDAIAVMGADPGPDMTYTLGMIHDYFVGGFCTAADGPGKVGQLCTPKRAPLTDQREIVSDFEHFPYQAGDGVGLTLRRQLFVRANRDLARAMGNAAYYNTDSPYLPPGVPTSYLQLPVAQQCAQPVVLKNFFDGRYNPDGSKDVITFCDGNDDSNDPSTWGNFTPSVPATDPTQILLAVDINGNGKRDSGEPVIVQGNEPFSDVGIDGLADAQEPGYDPVTNPDPNGDDYHYLWNPTGTENNWRYDQGEPFVDSGIDGVKGAGCPYNPAQNCWDYGEGNGVFDYSPGAANWKKHDPRGNLEAMTVDAFDRIDTYYDAGIRDFFNAHVSTNSLMAALTVKHQSVRAYDGFPAFFGLAPSQEMNFEISRLDIPSQGRHVFVRYGDPDLSEAAVESSGDGRHVGTALQAVHRAQMMLYWAGWRWQDGDKKIPMNTSGRTDNQVLMQDDGRMSPYIVVLPPGYDSPDEASVTYPVLYLGHGLGMKPEDLAQIAVVAQNAMVDAHVSDDKRLPKFIIVSLDGACRPDGQDVSQMPLAPGDLCEEGAFYTNHPEGLYTGEDMIMKIQDLMPTMYRVRPEADVMVEE